jgi:hypothetical protein
MRRDQQSLLLCDGVIEQLDSLQVWQMPPQRQAA